jgi:ATP-dependent phosphofructokinase / diphosphate-dependent phosphofructokinase
MKETVAICCGGGPAPGMNTVIGSITKMFLRNGWRVIGLHGGFSGLFTKEPRMVELDFLYADSIFNRGGSALKMSRFKPTDQHLQEQFNLDFFTSNNVKLLVSIGGDDTASTANRIAKAIAQHGIELKNIHVPKTIDNDLPLPDDTPTFGYHSAKEAGVQICNTVYEDARTSETWFIVAAMGRSAGHLAAGIGASCHYPMIVIPEMFNKTSISVSKIVNLVISSIVKRKLLGVDYGAAIVSEGVFHDLPEDEIKNSGIVFSYDDHGHPELGKVSKAHIFNELIENKCKELGLKVKSRPVEVGYELRCVRPIGYDLMYCSLLGMGVYQLYQRGVSGCMVYVNNVGNVYPLYLEDLQDVKGKIPPRRVDIESHRTQTLFRSNLQYIEESDYEAARKYLPNPEEFDFYKILNWV